MEKISVKGQTYYLWEIFLNDFTMYQQLINDNNNMDIVINENVKNFFQTINVTQNQKIRKNGQKYI